MPRIVTGFDLETTGLLEPEHRIIEIAAILYDLDTGGELGRLVHRFNPGRPIDPGATAVHGITFEDVQHLPKLEDSPRELEMLTKIAQASSFWVAHNGIGFDIPFVTQEFIRIGRAIALPPCLDTMVDGTWATPDGKLPSLQELCFACGVDYDPAKAHAAEYDVRRMMECFFFARQRGFFKDKGAR